MARSPSDPSAPTSVAPTTVNHRRERAQAAWRQRLAFRDRAQLVAERAGTPLALLALLVALLPALTPLIAPGMPGTDDGAQHLLRIIALDRLGETGVPFARWLPDLAFGYGMPVFNYYPPLVYLPAEVAHRLGAGYVASFELTAGLCLVASAVAMFALARALFGLVASLAAALVYAYLPYQLVDLYVRGALAESAAFAWMPLLCWCLLRLRADPRRRWAIGLTVSLAGLVLTHAITALILAPALAALAAALVPTPRSGPTVSRRAFAMRVLRAAVVGVSLAAWSWLPALLERDLVQLSAGPGAGATVGTFDVEAESAFQQGLAYDYGVTTVAEPGLQPVWAKLGLVQLLISLVGVAAMFGARGLRRRVLAWAALMAAGAWALQSAAAAPLYTYVPLASLVQFAWRLLMLVGLGSALLAAGVVAVAPRRPGAFLAAGLIGLSMWTAVVGLLPSFTFPEERFLSAEAPVRAELAGAGLGTTPLGEFIPTSTGLSNADELRRAVLGDDPIADADAERPPVAYRIEQLDWTSLAINMRVAVPQPDRLLVHQFAFPGWQARVDGVAAPLAPGGRLALLAVDLPTGVHDVELRFGWTEPRLAGVAVSMVAAVAFAAVLGRPGTGRRGVGTSRTVGVGACLATATAALLGAVSLSSAASVAPASQAQSLELDGRLSLVGSSLDASRLANGGPLAVRLGWLALVTHGAGYDAGFRIEGADGTAHEARWLHGPLSRRWQRGELVKTETDLRLPNDFPAGAARVLMQLRPRDAGGATQTATVLLGEVTIPAGRPADGVATAPARPLASDVELVSHELRAQGALGRGDLRSGDVLDAYLTWRVLDVPRGELAAVLNVRGPLGSATRHAHLLRQWFDPTFAWQVGDSFRQHVRYVIEAELPPGEYAVTVQLHQAERLGLVGVPAGRYQFLAEAPLGRVTVRP